MNQETERPLLHVLGSSWLSMLGVALVTTAGCSWLFVLPVHIRGHVDNPYIGLLVFFAIPAIFFTGLALIPIGIYLGKRKVAAEFSTAHDRKALARRFAIFLGVTTFVNIVIGSQVTYRAVEHMESVQFCGQTCHVMQPEFTAHMVPSHQKVACVDCHVVPGAAGFVAAKMAGTRQMIEVVFNTFPRPIESAIESNRLAPSVDTCENCHSRTKDSGTRLRVIAKYKDDEANTPSFTVLNMMVGGGTSGGIHGAHMGPGVHIRYAAGDAKRTAIPWVEYKNDQTGQTRTYLASDAKPGTTEKLPQFEMQCSDCHNRAAHSFELADRALDRAFVSGELSTSLPYLKKTGLELLKAGYTSRDEATQKIPESLAAFYRAKYPDVISKHSAEVTSAGKAIASIYSENVFPDLKVTWGTYPSNLGHTDAPGCFRCHDDSHSTAQKKTITQDCGACHQSVAVEEQSPEVLKTLGIADRIAKLQHN
jgi:nitrate/TMAO reductase-like tetraheme cytochrome c subunit